MKQRHRKSLMLTQLKQNSLDFSTLGAEMFADSAGQQNASMAPVVIASKNKHPSQKTIFDVLDDEKERDMLKKFAREEFSEGTQKNSRVYIFVQKILNFGNNYKVGRS